MRTIIAGSRNITSIKIVEKAIKASKIDITCVICGGAAGVDSIGKYIATINNIPVEMYLAQWDQYGKKAGFIRNEQMAENADALIAIWNGVSSGTKHMIETAKRHGLKVSIYVVK